MLLYKGMKVNYIVLTKIKHILITSVNNLHIGYTNLRNVISLSQYAYTIYINCKWLYIFSPNRGNISVMGTTFHIYKFYICLFHNLMFKF